ncbi:hypothetical protein [Variovorax sp. KK3]|uniref:hypothetical protein n=1 Tax=Variovorax sp. KK3 TaxID=1855728 RepID=UPI00097CB2C5|nr:hypothetical protein [Variovorax sp. KK3]
MKNQATRIAILPIAVCVLWASTAANGTTAWRCGSNYSDRPCEDGKPLAVGDTRDPAQKREADRATREAQSAADRMERERLKLEKAQAKRQPVLIDSRPPAPRPEPVAIAANKKKKGQADPGYFSAHDPVATAKKKAEKAADKSASRRGSDKS